MKVESKVAASFGLALLAVLLVGSLIYGNNRALLRHNAQVVHTYQVLDRIGGIFDLAQEIESGMRGYILTGRDEFLDVYQKSIDALTPQVNDLRAEVSDNPAQITRVNALEGVMRRKIEVSQERVDQRRSEGLDNVVRSFDGRGKATMDELRRHVSEMRNVELALLDQRMNQSASSARRVIMAYGVLLGVAVLMLGVFFFQVRNDLRERIRVNSLLESNERRFRGVMESAPDAMAVTDQKDRITMTNSAFAALFAVPAAEAQGRPLKDFLHLTDAGHEDQTQRTNDDDAAAAVVSANGEAADAATTGHAELGVRLRGRELTTPLFLGRRTGQETPFPAEVTRSTLRAVDGGDGVTTITAIRDLTERVEAEDELRKYSEDLARSNTELERFAYVASHDLQEPLRMVSSYTQLLSRRYRGKLGADADEFISFAVDGANRMQKLINDLLMYSRVGSRPIEQLPVDCEALLARVRRDMHDTLESRSAIVEHDPLPPVRGDAIQIGQLFQNLIGNATKFQRPDAPPVVRITVEPSANQFWRFSCQDNGIGIDPQYFERIFVIFQRLHGKDQYPGTGIGLAICKKIVERHGGRLWVESEPGRGANFLFTLPAIDA